MGPPPEDGAAAGAAVAHGAGLRGRPDQSAVAETLHVSSNSVCKWRERFRVRRLAGLTDEPRPGRAAQSDRRSDRRRHHAHARRPAAARDAMDHAQHGGRRRSLESHHLAHLADVWLAVASPRHVQVVGGPAVCRKSARHRRAVSQSAGSRHGALPWTKRVRSRPWIARGRCCRCARASRPGRPTTTFATARRRCSRRWMSRPGKSSGSVIGAIGIRSF